MTRRILLSLALTVAFCTAQAKVITDSIASHCLGATVKVNVYLPPSFDANTELKYPVLYLLHGFTDTYDAWEQKGHLGHVADSLLAEGDICPMVIIMPNAGGPDTKNTWNGYFNMPGWAYEDFFFTELMPTFEAKYHIIGDKQHRAISGLSMGGGGSTVYAQRHPELFSSCYAMSAWLSSDGAELNPADKSTYVVQAVHEHCAVKYVQNATEEVKNELRSIRWYFDIGSWDFLFDKNIEMMQAMRTAIIPAVFRTRPGVHNWHFWNIALHTSLPFATAGFHGEKEL